MKKRFFAVLSVLLALTFTVCACEPTTGPDDGSHTHVDANNDGVCDECQEAMPGEGGGEEEVDPDKGTPWTPPAGEYTIECPQGMNQITFYFQRSSGSYSDCDIWLWEVGGAEGRGFLLHECDYGAKAVINISEECTQVGFIVRTGCTEPGGTSWGTANKDATQDDRFFSIKDHETFVFLKQGDSKAYRGFTKEGVLNLEEVKTVDIADMASLTTIKYSLSARQKLTEADVKITDSTGRELPIQKIEALSKSGTITMGETLDMAKAYTFTVLGFDEPVPVVPLTYFSSSDFENAYLYDGELGVELSAGKTVFRLWAPTASEVKLNLFNEGDGGEAYKTVSLTRGEKGVWSYEEQENLNGKYYTYTVSTSAGEQEAVDPYAVSAGLNGNRGMILDLGTTDPAGWDDETFEPEGFTNYTDAEIWEIHVRDFSNNISSSRYKGKFLAFTETGLKNANGKPVGVDYLKELGITHVHLMPSFDYATVDESGTGGFNWGYDPKNYNVPEGSYSTDAAHGEVRVKEFKQMVEALHKEGIGVIMDVVYNHTSGLDSNFNRIVPYYYYRFRGNGKASNGSGCGNETASERKMFRKYMVESVEHWLNEYHVDGFRFDLMGLHDTVTMQEIEKAVHAINPKALIYGEGWTGGGTTLATGSQSTLANIKAVNTNSHTNGVAMFNDVTRDALKGSTNGSDTGFSTGGASQATGILFGVNGGVADSDFGATNSRGWYTYNPTNLINYASAHDNLALWDKICWAYGTSESTLNDRLSRNRLTAAIVQTSLGIPFMQAGEEMLRSKPNPSKTATGGYDENSYNSPDSVNNLKWDDLSDTSPQWQMMQYYKGLIAFRKSSAILRSPVTSDRGVTVCRIVQNTGTLVAFTMTNPYNSSDVLFIVYNAGSAQQSVTLPSGSWDLMIDGTRAGTEVLQAGCSGSFTVSGISCYVFHKS